MQCEKRLRNLRQPVDWISSSESGLGLVCVCVVHVKTRVTCACMCRVRWAKVGQKVGTGMAQVSAISFGAGADSSGRKLAIASSSERATSLAMIDCVC